VIGAIALGIRLFQRLASPGKAVIVTELLGPGETLVISNLPPGR